MASTPASVTKVSRRFAERGDGGAGFSERRGPSLINPWMIVRGAISYRRHTCTRTLANFPLTHCYISVMVTGAPEAIGRRLRPIFEQGIPDAAFGVRVEA